MLVSGRVRSMNQSFKESHSTMLFGGEKLEQRTFGNRPTDDHLRIFDPTGTYPSGIPKKTSNYEQFLITRMFIPKGFVFLLMFL